MDRRAPPRRIQLTEPDLDLLRFLAEHRIVLSEHAAVLLDRSPRTARDRLTKLVKAGYVREAQPFRGMPPMYLIERAGLKVIGSRFRPLEIDMTTYRHDVGVAWLWLAARHGTFGPLQEVVAERRLRSHDKARDADTEPLGVRAGGLGPQGQESLHYPDLLLKTEDGRRFALELELSGKERTRLEKILLGYGADPRIDGVVYLVEQASVARAVTSAARRVGVSHLVHLQRVRSTTPDPVAGHTLTAARNQAAGHGPTAARNPAGHTPTAARNPAPRAIRGPGMVR